MTSESASVVEGELLWTPSSKIVAEAQVTRFEKWLERERQLHFSDYEAMWRWSVSELETFWGAIWDYFEVISDSAIQTVLSSRAMPGALWFEGARVNYAEHVLRHEANAAPDEVAFYHMTEIRPLDTLSWVELGAKVRALATWLRAIGIAPGDRVVSYMPNVPETAVAMLAVTAIGAVWSAASPEFGAKTVIERFGQIAPKLAFVADGYSFNGRQIDRRAEIAEIAAALPSLERLVWLPYLGLEREGWVDRPVEDYAHTLIEPVSREAFRFERVASDHPLWILFSSGTTGLPKAIVHGHAGIIVEQFKSLVLHSNLRPGSRMFVFTTTGWMMWNSVVSALISGASAVLYDGSPVHGQVDLLWRIAAQTRTTFFGASATLVANMKAAGVRPGERYDLSALEVVMLGGSPSTPETYGWLYDNVRRDLWVTAPSGGTEVCTALVGGMTTLPVYAGEIQCRCLGIDAHVWNEVGEELIEQIGELVVTSPMPSAPLFFWGDAEGKRYFESYYSTYPGVWRHGDLAEMNSRGGVYIYGRSDATLNRYGVRIGTAEVYRVVEQVPGVTDSLVVCCQTTEAGFYMPMFLSLMPGIELTAELKDSIATKLRSEASPRHVPDAIFHVPGVPYTLTGKKMEVPIRRLIMGEAIDRVLSRDAMSNPALLDWYVDFARSRAVGQAP